MEAVWVCAKYLFDMGYEVKIRQMGRAKAHSEWRDAADNGDLEICLGGQAKRIEVKGLSCDFQDGADWPFPDFIVCASHSWNRADPKPYAYMILNKHRTHMGIVRGQDSKDWIKVKRQDQRYMGVEQEFYLSPLKNVMWRSIPFNWARDNLLNSLNSYSA